MLPKYIEKIGEGLSLRIKQVNSVWQLHTDGSTIPFIARYRKEATGNLDEVQIAAVIEQIQYFEELEKRKQTVLKTIEGLGKLTPELQQHIDNCFEAAVLEDIYLPYKPKRKT
ncbi:MAG TPA: Tex-like N-terminal domain-containing protein, partial [Chitinophagaceae bacterium]|nr:Tex-like N-terminal domain-containing protein [Chitinophagaceae bacterium]